MKVLHIENTSGVAALLARGERALGHEATVLETYREPYGFEHDISNFYEGHLPAKIRAARRTLQEARGYDIVHVHAGLPRRRLDYLWIREVLGKPLVVHYHGCETREGYGMHYRGLADAKVVATPDLLPLHPDAVFVPNPMAVIEAPWPDGPMRVLHAPSNRAHKGTDMILQALDSLWTEGGRRFEFELVENRPHREVLEAMTRSHIVVDQVTKVLSGVPAGCIGMVSLEAMAMGRAVVSSLDPASLGKYYPLGCPVVYAEGGSVMDVLASLLDDPEMACRLGEKGKRWVFENLGPDMIARQHLEIYERVLEGAE